MYGGAGKGSSDLKLGPGFQKVRFVSLKYDPWLKFFSTYLLLHSIRVIILVLKQNTKI